MTLVLSLSFERVVLALETGDIWRTLVRGQGGRHNLFRVAQLLMSE